MRSCTSVLFLLAAALSGCGGPRGAGASEDALGGSSENSLVQPAATPTAGNGPFGIERGQDIRSLQATAEPQPGWYRVTAIPRPHPDFDELQVMAAPGVGVCRIAAISPVLSEDRYGSAIRERVDRVAAQLGERYGPGEKTDFCDTDASTCREGYWSMHIHGGARSYRYSWRTAQSRPLPSGLASIDLFVGATDTYAPYAILRYTFDNDRQCERALNREAGQAL